MNKSEIFNKVQAIIMEQLDKGADEVTLTTNFKSNLNADSLDVFEIINEIEDEFDVKIETDEEIATVSDLVDFVAQQLA
ncbi:acyl carrier protein [Loigolactobacillus jiayinensis]|uniref:Acyl carrier protein n=1 Tax=Loigolactobacillus jiayinensis TaxID=2486016 RepID=A0ABW1R815_9LACO|nr:acyl carrier protein [Loigolactobacillus jiayinensis]